MTDEGGLVDTALSRQEDEVLHIAALRFQLVTFDVETVDVDEAPALQETAAIVALRA